MKKIIHLITIILCTLFLMSWVKLIPAPFRHYVLLFSPPIIIISLLFFSGGLELKYKKIIKVLSLIILTISSGLTIYYISLGGIGIFFYLVFCWAYSHTYIFSTTSL
jgi:hypothetical protein